MYKNQQTTEDLVENLTTKEYFVLGRIHLVLNKTLRDDTSVKRAQINFFCVLSNFVETWWSCRVPMCAILQYSVNNLSILNEKWIDIWFTNGTVTNSSRGIRGNLVSQKMANKFISFGLHNATTWRSRSSGMGGPTALWDRSLLIPSSPFANTRILIYTIKKKPNRIYKSFFRLQDGGDVVVPAPRWQLTTESIDQYRPRGNAREGKCQMICHSWSKQAQEIPWIPVQIEIQELRGLIFWQ